MTDAEMWMHRDKQKYPDATQERRFEVLTDENK